MDATTVFVLGAMATLAIGIGVVWYLGRPLRNILIELCGNEGRAEFWTAFSAVAVGVVPVIFAIACRPTPGPGAPAAAHAPAVTESILAQVVATSSGTIVTSRGPRALASQAKKPGLAAVRQ